MTDPEVISSLIEVISQIGIAGIAIYLLVREQRMHEQTRTDARSEREIREAEARAEREKRWYELTTALRDLANIRLLLESANRNREDSTNPKV